MPELSAVAGYQKVRFVNCSVSSPSIGNPPIRPKQLSLPVNTIKESFVMLRTVLSHLDPLLSRTDINVTRTVYAMLLLFISMKDVPDTP